MKDPVKVKCENCGNEWNYRGKRPEKESIPFYVLCNVCRKWMKVLPQMVCRQ
jgi:formate dehydrogenase maturation protein FdhE